MAETVVLETWVKGITNIKDLKSELKGAKEELLKFDAGTKAFDDAQKKVSLLKDRLGDLGDSAKIAGTPTERLGQSFGLMGEALRGADLDKAKLAFTGIGQAMSAIPIFLLVEGLNYVVQNFDKVIKLVEDFTGATAEAEKAIKAQTKALQEQGFEIQDLGNEYKYFEINRQRAIALEVEQLKQRGATQQEIDKAIIKSEEEKLKELKSLRDRALELGLNQTVAQNKVFEQMDKIDILNAQLKTAQITASNQKEKDDAIRIHKELLAEKKILDEQAKIAEGESQSEFDEIFKQKEAENNESDLTAYVDHEYKKMLEGIKIEENGAKQKKEIDAQLTAEKKKQEAARLQAQQIGFNAAQSLSNTFFQFQLNRAKGNAADELKIRKQMFEVDKAFNVARAVQDGIRSVQAALTIPPPAGYALAAANGVLAVANVAKILATQFDGGGGGASVGQVSTPTVNVPSISSPQPRQGSTLLDDFGNPITQEERDRQVIRAYVVERDLTNKQKNRSRIEEQSKF